MELWDRSKGGGKIEDWLGLAGDLNGDGYYDHLNRNLTTSYQVIKAKTVSVRAQKAYLFNTPSTNGYSRGPVDKGEKLNVIEQNGSFWFVKGSNGHGFITKTVAY